MKQDIIYYVPLDQLEPDPKQPRKGLQYASDAGEVGVEGVDSGIEDLSLDDDRADASSLADSVLAHGVLQAILVEQLSKTRFKIIAGERRWRAAKAAKARIDAGRVDKRKLRPGYNYAAIPAMVVEGADRLDSRSRLETQLVENVQRRAMEARDVGAALQALREAGSSMRDIARRLGKNTGWVQNMLFAATDSGQELWQKLGTADWHYMRRLNAQKNERPPFATGEHQTPRPGVWDAVMDRIGHGEPFSRQMLEDEIKAWDADNEAELSRAEYEMREARDEEHRIHGAGDVSLLGEDLDAIAEEMAQDTRDLMRHPTKRFVQAYKSVGPGPKRLQGETDAQWLYRSTESAYEELVENERAGEEMVPGVAPTMEEPGVSAIPVPDPEVTVHLVLPKTQVMLLGGLLDDLATMDLPAPHKEARSAKELTEQLEQLARRLHRALD